MSEPTGGAVGDRAVPDPRSDLTHDGSPPAEVRRAALSSFIGTTVEFYDFLLYGSAAALIFDRLFFSNLSPGWATVASFATFAAGYVARLIGGVLFAHFGDRAGRKSVLIITMLMMGTATGLMGLLPTYGQIGVAAPVLLVILRVVQGLAAGGEYGGAAVMSAEHAPSKRRGLIGTATTLGLPFGGLLATAVFTLVSLMPTDAFMSWGWRVPFLIGFVLVAVGLWVRLKVTETPAFQITQQRVALPKLPITRLMRNQPLAVTRGILVVMPCLAASSLFGSYLVSYAVSIGYSASQALLGVIISSAVALVALPLYGALSDRIGRRPVCILGTIATAALVYPALMLVDSGSLAAFYFAQSVMVGIVSTAISGPTVALLSEMFDTEIRYTGVAMTYQAGTVLAGGIAPLIAALLAASGATTGSGAIAVIFVVLGVGGTIAILFIRESRGLDLTQSVLSQHAGGTPPR